ncbi:MAG TPA: hypothetical protein VGM90_19780 [Kofleriaceae bacterium]
MRRRLTAYGVVMTLGMLLVWYGMSANPVSRHGFNELFAIMIGGIIALVGAVGAVIVALRAIAAKRE